MLVSKSYKFKLLPKPLQRIKFAKYAGSCRFVYNWGLSQKKKSWESDKKTLSYNFLANELTKLKKGKETDWLNEAPAQLLQQSLKDLDQAYQNFFRRIKEGKVGREAGEPRFKKKGKTTDSFRFPQASQFSIERISNRRSFLKLPKVGNVKFLRSREIEGRIRNCTIIKEGKSWFVSFNTEVEIEELINVGTSLGIDRGITHTLVTSEGNCYDLPTDKIKELELRKSILQRRGRNKVKFSKSWENYQNKLRDIDRKVTRIRHDFLHKASADLAQSHSYICLEELKIKNMSISGKGTVDEPGKNVKAKSGLNRSILRQGWYKFETLLDYKTNWYGGYLDLVDPKNTSRACARCGHTSADNRKTQALFSCQSCGFKTNADYNAAINIITRGHWGRASGDVELIESLKLEPITLH